MPANFMTAFDSSQYFTTKDFELRYSDHYLPRKQKKISDSVELFFFIGGKMSLHLDGKLIPLKKFDVVYLPLGTVGAPLTIDENQPNQLFFLRLNKNYISQLKNQSDDFGYLFDFTADPKPQLFRNESTLFNTIIARLLALTDEIRSDRYGRNTQIYIALNDLILHLNRLAYNCAEKDDRKSPKTKTSLFRNLIHYVEMNISEDLTLDHLAEVFFVSKYYISHLFKETTGISLHQYITKKRLSLCRDSLLDGANISKTYNLYGFKDYSSFYRAFRKEYGMSPKAYRENKDKEKDDPGIR